MFLKVIIFLAVVTFNWTFQEFFMKKLKPKQEKSLFSKYERMNLWIYEWPDINLKRTPAYIIFFVNFRATLQLTLLSRQSF